MLIVSQCGGSDGSVRMALAVEERSLRQDWELTYILLLFSDPRRPSYSQASVLYLRLSSSTRGSPLRALLKCDKSLRHYFEKKYLYLHQEYEKNKTSIHFPNMHVTNFILRSALCRSQSLWYTLITGTQQLLHHWGCIFPSLLLVKQIKKDLIVWKRLRPSKLTFLTPAQFSTL